MLRELEQDIWVAEQPLRYFGLSIGARMTVIRREDEKLTVISPIRVNKDMGTKLDSLGTVTDIIAPNLYHYFFANQFKARYPTATFWAAPGLKGKEPDLLIDKVIQPLENSSTCGLETIFFEGFRTLGSGGFESLNECVFFHAASRTLILTDTAFHFDESSPLLTQFAFRVTGTYKQLSPSRLERIATTDKDNVRKSVQQILRWDFERVVVAHGSIVERQGKERFRLVSVSFRHLFIQATEV
ncbi:MAG: DUF4336 domain-containing protein [Cyanobacteria bacterium P01_F01_bin.53]